MKLLGRPKTVLSDYKKFAIYLPTTFCTLKCMTELKQREIKLEEHEECHNHKLLGCNTIELSTLDIKTKYIDNNPLVECVILSGLDPMDDFDNSIKFIKEFRELDKKMEIVIFTGYEPEEIMDKINLLKEIDNRNITFKFGRFRPDLKPRYDEVGEVTLISGNQYFKNIQYV